MNQDPMMARALRDADNDAYRDIDLIRKALKHYDDACRAEMERAIARSIS